MVHNGVASAWDDVNDKILDAAEVKQARKVELEYFETLGVYTRVPKSHQQRSGGKIIGTRWVDVNKGDETTRNYRSRLVGKEYRHTPTIPYTRPHLHLKHYD